MMLARENRTIEKTEREACHKYYENKNNPTTASKDMKNTRNKIQIQKQRTYFSEVEGEFLVAHLTVRNQVVRNPLRRGLRRQFLLVLVQLLLDVDRFVRRGLGFALLGDLLLFFQNTLIQLGD
jgi:hypothetical protein